MHITPVEIACYVIISAFLSLATQILSSTRITWRNLLLAWLFCFITCCVDFFLERFAPSAKLLMMIINILMIYLVINRFRGTKLLFTSFVMLMISFGGDIIAGTTSILIFDSEAISAMRELSSPMALFMQLGTGLCMVAMAILWHAATSRLGNKRQTSSQAGYLLRPLCMLGIIALIFARTLAKLQGVNEIQKYLTVLPDFIIILLLLAIGITYIVQDIRFFRQKSENNALMYQQSLQNVLLQDTRIFRHNVSNMLYGLQGTLLSGDMDAVRNYYESMVEACQLINNENVVALKRLPSPAVGTLILNKMHLAGVEKIPFFITVTEDIRWHGLRDSEMTQVLGILLDNALEAAREAASPYVSFEARNEGGTLSLTIRNTYRGDQPPMLSLNGESTKAGHDGLGLMSLQKILKKHPRALFSIYPAGRYVEACLIFE